MQSNSSSGLVIVGVRFQYHMTMQFNDDSATEEARQRIMADKI